MSAKSESSTPASKVAYRLKCSKPVMEFLKNKPAVALLLPKRFEVGDRLFMVEWQGGAIGRADLCRVLGHDGEQTLLQKSWGWHQGKLDEDLAFLGLTVSPTDHPMVNADVIPRPL